MPHGIFNLNQTGSFLRVFDRSCGANPRDKNHNRWKKITRVIPFNSFSEMGNAT
jgi:hypothetical protein